MEAFVLSRVDGRATENEIALATGLGVADVIEHLRRLAALGAVEYGTGDGISRAPGSGKVAITPAAVTGSVSGTHEVTITIDDRSAHVPPPPVNYDPWELEEVAEIPPERKRAILDLFYRLDALSHYELLHVGTDADKKAVKSAYFKVVGTFHPDKYYGKQLGSFKPKLERIFQRVTEAHDTLTRANRRVEYDRFLESQEATRALDQFTDPTSTLPEVDELFREMEREAREAADAGRSSVPPARTSTPPPAALGSSPSHNPVSSPWNSVPPPGSESARAPRPITAEERRRALARKLGASGAPPHPRAVIAPQATQAAVREAAAEALKRRYETHLSKARDDRLKRYLQAADDAMAKKNVVAAANALRIAVSLAPDNAAISERFVVVEQKAAAALADQYIEQAKYEERRGEFTAAITAYERALRGRPSAQLHDRVAFCVLESRGDNRKATDHARKAVEMAGTDVSYRITLARAYARSGMEQSALGELERARTLAPSDDTIKDWIKRVKRGEI